MTRREADDLDEAPRPRSRKKLFLLVLGLPIILMVGGGLLATWRLDAVVASGVERQGSRVMGTPVEVDEVELSLFSGEGIMRGVEVRNPAGFREENIFSVEEVQLALSPLSVLSGGHPVHVRELTVQGAEIDFEAKLLDTNIGQLRRHLDSTRRHRSGEARSEVLLRVDRLSLRESTVHLVFNAPGRFVERTVTIPDIEFQNLGGEAGLPPRDLATVVAQKVADQVWTAAVKSPGPWKGLRDDVRQRLQKVSEDDVRQAIERGGQLVDRLRRRFGSESGSESDGGLLPEGDGDVDASHRP